MTLSARLTAWSVKHPRWVLASAAGVALLALAAVFLRLEVRTSNLDLIDPELPEIRRFRAFTEAFGNPAVAVVVLDGEPASVAASVDLLAPRLRASAEVRSVVDRLPLDPDAAEVLGMDAYFRSEDRRLGAVFVQPVDVSSGTEALEPFVAALRQTVEDATPELEALGVEVGLTGLPVYAIDDKTVIQRDISRYTSIGALGILALFVVSFKDLRRPAAAVATLVVSLAWTLGVASYWPGHLTLISAFFGSILFGVGIDFAVHCLDRVQHFEHQGLRGGDAWVRAVDGLARPLRTAGLTSASFFFVMMVTGFQGFAELGWVAGVGLLFAWGATLTVLPALAVSLPARADKTTPAALDRLGRRLLGLPQRFQSRTTAMVLGVLTLAAGLATLGAEHPRFDSDYTALQPAKSDTVRWEKELVARSSWSSQFAVLTVDSREELLDRLWALADEPLVASVRSLRNFEVPGLPGAVPEMADDLLHIFKADDGRLAIYAYPSEDLWQPGPQDAFVERLQAIDPEVTGMPFVGHLMLDRSREAGIKTGLYGLVLLALFLAWDFRRPSWFLPALMPAVATLPACAGIMALLGLDFHPLNIMAWPVVLGIAVDDGVHLVHRYRQELGRPRAERLHHVLQGTGRSIWITSLTNLAAFGCLMLTEHRGLASFAQLLCLGVTVALILTTWVLPQLLLALHPGDGEADV